MCPELVHLRLSGPRHSVSGPFIVGVRSAVLCADPRVRRVRMAGVANSTRYGQVGPATVPEAAGWAATGAPVSGYCWMGLCASGWQFVMVARGLVG
jgi:hypothetical protein